MLLQQVLEELSSCYIVTSSEDEEKVRGTEAKASPFYHKQQHSDPANEQHACGNHKGTLVAPTVGGSAGPTFDLKRTAAPTLDLKRTAPVTRHTNTTNAQYLYRAAVAAKKIQVSSHGRLSAPALLANCLLSMIPLSDDEDDQATAKIEDTPSFTKDEGRHTILKSFSQLHAEGRNKDAHHHSLQANSHKKLQVITCCLFPCNKRNISESVGSTLELFNNSDELSSSNDDGNSRSRVRINGEGGGTLRSLVKKVLCKGSSEAGTGSSLGDQDLLFDERWAGGTPISTQSHVKQDESDMINDNHSSSMYEYEYMYDSGYGNLLPVRKGECGGLKKSACASEMDGGVAQEVVHEVISLSHDAPIASSFVFEQSCFSPSSSTSSTTHCMKLESAHPWLISGDLESCTTSPQNDLPVNRVFYGIMQDDLQYRLANKRLNLSR